MDYHTATLTLDVAEGYSECEATFEVDALWSRHRDRHGMRRVDHVNGVSLESWTFDGRQQNRATAVALIGEAEVERQEDLARTAWLETAEQDDADGYADYQRDQRVAYAAE
ncbi:hypothetical protein RM190_04795 [Paracoccus sp. CPCC 101403]|uniref:Uncharacterized protein n=1 Tax=Paracoccus broussonetiae TaxID=3075834 RepID=A0ABU3EAC1_9RHOB|nr:hypothetical protein [Paracoccus sp. CPCC 101403]MDT1061166.1 hypothetical protein [Paracoccus sp. CPCC 101403]